MTIELLAGIAVVAAVLSALLGTGLAGEEAQPDEEPADIVIRISRGE